MSKTFFIAPLEKENKATFPVLFFGFKSSDIKSHSLEYVSVPSKLHQILYTEPSRDMCGPEQDNNIVLLYISIC